MKSILIKIFTCLLFLTLSGCGTLDESQVAKVHQAWNARYQYNPESRMMVSRYDNQKVGRSIGRDEWGRVDYDRYWTSRPFKGENLLKLRKKELDLKREAKWEEANRNLIEARKLELSQKVGIEDINATNTEEFNEDEQNTDEFLPTPFLPQGIDMVPENSNNFEDNVLLPPFEDGSPSVPMDDAESAPSPFDPLPPL